jgi:hypothetical protein
MLKALCLDVFVPGVFRVPVKAIIMDFQLKECMSFKIIGCLTLGRSRALNDVTGKKEYGWYWS